MTILYTRIACCKTKVTNRHSGYVIRIAFLLQQWLHDTRLCVTLYIHFLPVYPYSYALFLETQYRLEEYIELRTKRMNLTLPCFSFNWVLLHGAISYGFAII